MVIDMKCTSAPLPVNQWVRLFRPLWVCGRVFFTMLLPSAIYRRTYLSVCYAHCKSLYQERQKNFPLRLDSY